MSQSVRLLGLLALGVLGCQSPAEPLPPELLPVRDLRIPANVGVDEAVLAESDRSPAAVSLVFRNRGSSDAQIEYGLCSFSVLSYSSQARSGAPAWHALYPGGGGCGPDIGLAHQVQAGKRSLLPIGNLPDEAVRDPVSGAPRFLLLVIQIQGEGAPRRLEPVRVEGLPLR